MRKYGPLVLGFLVLCVPVALADQPQGKVVADTWEVVRLGGYRVGHVHTLTREVAVKEAKVLHTSMQFELTLKRSGAVQKLKFENGSDETADGKVVGVSVTMYTGPAKLTVAGRVEGDALVLRGEGGRELKRLPWDPSALGIYAQDRAWKEKKVKPGDRFEFTNYELAIERAFKVKVTVKEPEETVVLEVNKEEPKGKAEHVKRSLLRVEGVPDKVEVGGAPLQLPKVISWLDKDWNVLRTETQMPGLGRVITYRTTKTVAMEEGASPELLPDLLQTTLIRLDKAIDRPSERAEVVYRITVTGDDDPATMFARDARQSVENATGNTFNLRARAQRSPRVVDRPEKVGAEHRGSNHYLDSDDEVVKALAARAVGNERDPLTKARRIEKWVHDNMTFTSEIASATASQVARDLKGDCRQHAILTAAMCRAACLPSRTALGLVYTFDRDKGPVLAFHMWTEAYVVDQWLSLDAIPDRSGVSATHLKVADLSWHDTQTLAPMLSVLRVLEKIKVEVVAVK